MERDKCVCGGHWLRAGDLTEEWKKINLQNAAQNTAGDVLTRTNVPYKHILDQSHETSQRVLSILHPKNQKKLYYFFIL